MREFGTDRVGVDEPEQRQNIAQRRPRGEIRRAAAGVELQIQVRLGQTEIFQIEHIRLVDLLQPERVEFRDQMAPIGIDLDEAGDRALLRADFVGARGLRRGPYGGAVRAEFRQQALADRSMRHVGSRARCHTIKIRAPCRIDPFRVVQVPLV